MDRVDSTVRGRLTALAADLEARVSEVTADVEDAISRAIPEFAASPDLTGFREASIRENVEAMLRLVRVGIDAADVRAGVAPLAYARALAGRDTPQALIVRCYRVGQSRFLRHCLEGLSLVEVDASIDGYYVDKVASIVLIDHVSDFIDQVLDQVLTAYIEAREPQLPAASATVTIATPPVPAPNVDPDPVLLEWS